MTPGGKSRCWSAWRRKMSALLTMRACARSFAGLFMRRGGWGRNGCRGRELRCLLKSRSEEREQLRVSRSVQENEMRLNSDPSPARTFVDVLAASKRGFGIAEESKCHNS